jgi:hypothetical protein
VSLLYTIDLNAGWLMLVVERSPDTEQEGKVEQPPQGYDSDYPSTYDYPTTEDTNGTLNMEAVCVISLCPNWYLYGSPTVGHKLLRPKFNGIPITPWI